MCAIYNNNIINIIGVILLFFVVLRLVNKMPGVWLD